MALAVCLRQGRRPKNSPAWPVGMGTRGPPFVWFRAGSVLFGFPLSFFALFCLALPRLWAAVAVPVVGCPCGGPACRIAALVRADAGPALGQAEKSPLGRCLVSGLHGTGMLAGLGARVGVLWHWHALGVVGAGMPLGRRLALGCRWAWSGTGMPCS